MLILSLKRPSRLRLRGFFVGRHGWAGELNLRYTLKALFEGPFGTGYPVEHAERKRRDTMLLKQLKAQSQKEMANFLAVVDKELLNKVCRNSNVQELLQLDKL